MNPLGRIELSDRRAVEYTERQIASLGYWVGLKTAG